MAKICVEKKWALKSFSKRNIVEGNSQEYTWEEVSIDNQNFYLSIVYPKLLLVDRGVSVGSFDLSGKCGKIKIVYTNDKIGIKSLDQNGKVSLCRISFSSGNGIKTGTENCIEVVRELKKFVPITQESFHNQKETKTIVTQGLHEILNNLLSENYNNTEHVESTLTEFDRTKILDLLLLHPQFPTKVVSCLDEVLEQFSRCE